MTSAVAIVTGATGTLGGELVAALAADGLDVVAVSRSGAAPARGESSTLALDVADDAASEILSNHLSGRPVAMVVHAVGLPAAPGVLDVDPGLLGAAVNIKAGGFLRIVHAVAPVLEVDARLVAVGGHLGAEPTEFAPLAGVANAALANLVRQLVAPVGRLGATVHVVAPGPFDSPRVDGMVARQAAATGRTVADVRGELLSEYPLQAMPSAADVASVIVGLRSPAARCLNGSTIFADGGVKHSIF